MGYNETQSRKFAKQIHVRFGSQIATAVRGTPIPPEFIAGLIGVEAGKDREGQFKESATRFESHVFTKLQSVRDGHSRHYSKITRSQIKDASNDALKALATSYGLTQIMGWWTIHLGGTVNDLRDPAKHLGYTVKLLLLNSSGDFERGEYAGEFRQWNSGSETGKTFHADYVANAMAVMNAYRELGPVEPLVTEPVTEKPPAKPALDQVGIVSEPKQVPAQVLPTQPQINVQHADEVKADVAVPVPGSKDDKPIQATQGGRKSWIATAVGGLAGLTTAVGGWLQNNTSLTMVGVVCATVLLLALIFRQVIIDIIRLKVISDPTKINAK